MLGRDRALPLPSPVTKVTAAPGSRVSSRTSQESAAEKVRLPSDVRTTLADQACRLEEIVTVLVTSVVPVFCRISR